MNNGRGNFWAGFALAFCFNFLGILICLAINTEQTKKGAFAGWIVSLISDFIILIICLAIIGIAK